MYLWFPKTIKVKKNQLLIIFKNEKYDAVMNDRRRKRNQQWVESNKSTGKKSETKSNMWWTESNQQKVNSEEQQKNEQKVQPCIT